MFGWLFPKASTPPQPATHRVVRMRYDAARTTDDNKKHWAAADALSARAANSAEVRRKLRQRARYEVANNCYARGILNTVAAYCIGTGPNLTLQYKGSEAAGQDPVIRSAARQVETLWNQWARLRQLNVKLYTMRLAWAGDGEAFGVLVNAPTYRSPIALDLRLIEADQVDDPAAMYSSAMNDPGLVLDGNGNVVAYRVLHQHPGDLNIQPDWGYDDLPVDQVIHLFRTERPGQLRGIPEITAALPLFSQLRRFIQATLTAAETAADFAAIMYSDAPANEDDDVAPNLWERVEIERGAFVTVPNQTRMEQLKAEHPNANYDEFVKSHLREIARCMSVPAVVALGDASAYNYASGRLDIQSFWRQVSVDRSVIESRCLDLLFAAWLDEALLIPGCLPADFASTAADWQPSWRWTDSENVNRAQEASGQETELRNNATTLAREFARRGLDWEVELRQRAREIALLKELGLSTTTEAPPAVPPALDPNLQDAAV